MKYTKKQLDKMLAAAEAKAMEQTAKTADDQGIAEDSAVEEVEVMAGSNMTPAQIIDLKRKVRAALDEFRDEAKAIAADPSTSNEVKGKKLRTIIDKAIKHAAKEVGLVSLSIERSNLGRIMKMLAKTPQDKLHTVRAGSLEATVVPKTPVEMAKFLRDFRGDRAGHDKPEPLRSPDPVKQTLLASMDELHHLAHVKLAEVLMSICDTLAILKPADDKHELESFVGVMVEMVGKYIEAMHMTCALRDNMERIGIPGFENPNTIN